MLERPVSKAGWTRVSLGDVIENINDYFDRDIDEPTQFVAGEHVDEGRLTVGRWGLTDDGFFPPTFKRRFRAGDVLFHSRNIKKVASPNFDGVTGEKLFVLRSKDQSVLAQDYLRYLLSSLDFYSYAEQNWSGSVNKFFNWRPLRQYQLLLPPIQEQARLLDLLNGAEETTEALRRVVAAAKVLRQSTIDHFSRISDRPSVPLGEICEMQNGRPFPGDEYQRQGPRLLRPGNLGVNGYFKWDDGATVCLPARFEAEAAAFLLDAGDVVINLTAQSLEEGFMGRVCLARAGDRSLLNQRIGRFQRFSEDFSPEFVFRVLQSSRFQNNAVRMCEGSKIKHLFWQHLAPFRVPKLDAVEQAAVISTVREIDAQLEGAQARLASAMLDRARLFDLTQADEVNA